MLLWVGVILSENIHVWLADTQSKAQRQYWLEALQQIKTLSPKNSYSGHYVPKSTMICVLLISQ